MKMHFDKKLIETALLIFALTTILWCSVFGYVISKIDSDYKIKIEKLKTK